MLFPVHATTLYLRDAFSLDALKSNVKIATPLSPSMGTGVAVATTLSLLVSFNVPPTIEIVESLSVPYANSKVATFAPIAMVPESVP